MATYNNIDKFKYGDNIYKIGTPNIYAECSTAAATTAKVANNASTLFYLDSGSMAGIKFTYNVPANATLNVNSTGAYPIYYQGSAITDRIIMATDFCIFSFDKEHSRWLLVGGDRSIINYKEDFYRPGDTLTTSYIWFTHGIMTSNTNIWIPIKLDKKIGYNVSSITPTTMVGIVRQYGTYLIGTSSSSATFSSVANLTTTVQGEDLIQIKCAKKSGNYGGTTYSPVQVSINSGFTLTFA